MGQPEWGCGVTIHDFERSLAISKANEDAPWWASIYEKAFPKHLSAVSVKSDGWAQRGGIDRVITLASGKAITVDEKVRTEDWPDIALETWSDLERKSPGWMQKDLACDFIAYAFVPSQRCYLLPFVTLRRAWLTSGGDWIRMAKAKEGGFRFIDAKNRGYTTRSIAVPIPELLSAVAQAQIVDWAA